MSSLCLPFVCHILYIFVNQWSAGKRGPVIWSLKIPRTGEIMAYSQEIPGIQSTKPKSPAKLWLGNVPVNDFLALCDDHNIVDELSTVANMCHCGTS